MLKVVKLYLTPEDIKGKLGEEYKSSAVLFTKSTIGNDNCLEFECIIVDEEKMVRNERRERLITQTKIDDENNQSLCETCDDISKYTEECWLECPYGTDSSDED